MIVAYYDSRHNEESFGRRSRFASDTSTETDFIAFVRSHSVSGNAV